MYINFRNFTQQGYPVGYVTICVVTNNVCKQKKIIVFSMHSKAISTKYFLYIV